MCFQKRIFFSPFSPPCTCHSVFGCRTLKTGSRVEIYENAGFSFSCGGPKTDLRISDVIHLTAHALYVKEAIVFGYIHFRVFVFMGKNDLTRLCVHLCVLFLKKNRKKKSVHFKKNNNNPEYEWMRT